MTPDLHALEELQEALRSRAGTVPKPDGIAQRAAANARRIRTTRRVAAGSALAIALVALSPLVLRALSDERRDPVEPAPTVVSTLPWTETVPGLDLPVGEALSVAYAVGATVTLESRAVALEGAKITQVLDSAMGQIVVAVAGNGRSSIWLLDGSETLKIADDLALSGSLVQGLGYDGRTHIAYAVDGPDAREVFAGPLLDPQPLGSDDRYLAAGFMQGEPVFAAVVQPTTLTQFHTSDPRAADAAIEHEVVMRSQAPYGAGTTIPGWWEVDDGAVVFYQEAIGCNDARRVPSFGFDAWGNCDFEDGDFGVLAVGPTFGAMRATVYELESRGSAVQTFDLPRSSGGTTYDLEPLGWETPNDVIIRVAAYDSALDIRDRSPADGSYVAVRCSVDTGACERVPHPVDVVANALNKVD